MISHAIIVSDSILILSINNDSINGINSDANPLLI